MKKLVLLLLLVPVAFPQEQDATKLEDQYKTCARHSIPAEKCTLEIYRQLKEKDIPTLDAPAREAVAAAMTYRGMLKNPDSMLVRSATVVDFNLRKDAYHVILLGRRRAEQFWRHDHARDCIRHLRPRRKDKINVD